MAGKRLCEERTSAVLEQLRAGKTLGAISRELSTNWRSVKRIATEHGIEPAKRGVQISSEVEAAALKLVQTSRVTLEQLASSIGVRRRTLKRRLHRAGVRGYGRNLRPAEQQRIDQLIDVQGLRPPAVARMLGRNVRTVYRYRAAKRRQPAAPLAAAI